MIDKTIVTSRGQTYTVFSAWAPLIDGTCLIVFDDSSTRLSELAVDFEGLLWIDFDDPTVKKQYRFEGYSVLKSIIRSNGRVTIKLEKEGSS